MRTYTTELLILWQISHRMFGVRACARIDVRSLRKRPAPTPLRRRRVRTIYVRVLASNKTLSDARCIRRRRRLRGHYRRHISKLNTSVGITHSVYTYTSAICVPSDTKCYKHTTLYWCASDLGGPTVGELAERRRRRRMRRRRRRRRRRDGDGSSVPSGSEAIESLNTIMSAHRMGMCMNERDMFEWVGRTRSRSMYAIDIHMCWRFFSLSFFLFLCLSLSNKSTKT